MIKKSIEFNCIIFTLAWLKAVQWGNGLQGLFETVIHPLPLPPVWNVGENIFA
jgi:hypothetical protein